jgi:hypothetical protein
LLGLWPELRVSKNHMQSDAVGSCGEPQPSHKKSIGLSVFFLRLVLNSPTEPVLPGILLTQEFFFMSSGDQTSFMLTFLCLV